MRSPLASIAGACREPSPANAREAARQAWHREGIVLLRPEWFNSWADQKQVELLAEKAFGRRVAK